MPHTAPRSPRPASPASGRRDRLSVGPQALFVYGSLQFPEVLRALIDRVPDHSAAQAHGWRVIALPGRLYPGLIPGENTISGYLLTGLSPKEWRVLDAFEGPDYDLRRLDLVDGRHGWAYVCPPDAEILDQDWSPEDFRAQHLPAYTGNCTTWRRHHEAVTEQAG